MNKLLTEINGKFPFVLNDIRFMDSAYRAGFESISKAISANQNVVLWGVDVSIDGTEVTVTEGDVVINGEILHVDASSIEVGAGMRAVIISEISYDPQGNKLFGDGTLHDTYEIRKAIITTVGIFTPPSSNCVELASSTYNRISDRDFASTAEALEGILKNKYISPYSLHNHQSWVTPTFSGGFEGSLKIRKLTNGLFEIKGDATSPSASYTIATLAEEFWPSSVISIPCKVGSNVDLIEIRTDGTIVSITQTDSIEINHIYSL